MDPWSSILAKLTKPTYSIEGCWGSEWWYVLGSHLSTTRGCAITVALVAQIPLGCQTYKLELGGKDSEAMTILASRIPTSMERNSQAFEFKYEKITFAWVYYKDDRPTGTMMTIPLSMHI